MKRIVILLITGLLIQPGWAQPLETELELIYKGYSNGSSSLIVDIEDEDGTIPENAEINFYLVQDTLETLLGKEMADHKGRAQFDIEDRSKLFGSDHMANFKVVYEGTEEYEGSETDITIKDAVFTMTQEVIDSVNTLVFNLSSWDDEGEEIGVEDGEIYIFVPRLFGDLNVGEAWTDEDGFDQTKFPIDIPGDSEGKISIIARIDEHEEFGYLEVRETSNWGVPLVEEGKVEKIRGYQNRHISHYQKMKLFLLFLCMMTIT